MKKVELLAPAKNIKAINAGIDYADSFYFGAKDFNMRMQADNFTDRELARAVKMCHDRGKKVYFTSNILVYENELNLLYQALANAYEIGFDAAIVNDIAAIEYAKDIGIPIHVSTQQNISNSTAAKFFEKLGAERLILARECSLEQIAEIKSKLTTAGIEVFIHGAMCTSISGRCYFSMDVCGDNEHSANRGRCVQPCRREWRVFDEKNNEYIYDGVRFMNSRDLCMIEYIPELIEANIDAFKIEGRMRSPHYVEIVTKIYHEAIESYYKNKFTKDQKKMVGKWIYELKKVYNRGFTNGFYLKRATQEDQQHVSPTNLSHWRLIELGQVLTYSKTENKAKVLLRNGRLKEGMRILLQGGTRSDTYFHQTIKLIEYKNHRVKSTRKASYNSPVVVWINAEEQMQSKKRDKLYIFTNKTYRHRKKRSDKKLRKKDYYKL
ncbi:MAG: U32 family peptidase [Candidatus Lokiarchaeota archaeon]|nr:U32 family peptidase [Candidatus Lokiarchaeota archaeon]